MKNIDFILGALFGGLIVFALILHTSHDGELGFYRAIEVSDLSVNDSIVQYESGVKIIPDKYHLASFDNKEFGPKLTCRVSQFNDSVFVYNVTFYLKKKDKVGNSLSENRFY